MFFFLISFSWCSCHLVHYENKINNNNSKNLPETAEKLAVIYLKVKKNCWTKYYEAKIVYFNHILSVLGGRFAIDVFVFVPPWRFSVHFVHGLWLESWNGNTARKNTWVGSIGALPLFVIPTKTFFLKLNNWIFHSEDVSRSVVPCASASAHWSVSRCRRPLETAWHQETAF